MRSKKSYIYAPQIKKTTVTCQDRKSSKKTKIIATFSLLLALSVVGIATSKDSEFSNVVDKEKIEMVVIPVEATIDYEQLNLLSKEAMVQQRKDMLVDKISETYKVSPAVTRSIVNSAHITGKTHKIDPVLILAITAVESTFDPNAVSTVGAVGLMQALPRAHPEKFARIRASGKSPFDMQTNLDVGGQIYAEYQNKFKGNRILALQQYNGSLKDKSYKYSNKVMRIYQFLGNGLPEIKNN